jgi:hypothetical protein
MPIKDISTHFFLDIYFSQLIARNQCVVIGGFAMIGQSGVNFVYHII